MLSVNQCIQTSQMKEHVIETEEHFLLGRGKTYLLKRVYCDYIFYHAPYIENQDASEKIKNIFDFVRSASVKKNNIYLDTRFDVETVVSYDTCHKVLYNMMTDDGVKYFYENICGFSEPYVLKQIRNQNIDCKLHKITVSNIGSVESIHVGIRKNDLLNIVENIQYPRLLDLLEVFDDIEDITPSWILRFDANIDGLWVGFYDNISPEDHIEEHLLPQYYKVDWYKVKENLYSNLNEKGFIDKEQYDYIMQKTRGSQPTELYFCVQNQQINQIVFKNMVTYKFEDVF